MTMTPVTDPEQELSWLTAGGGQLTGYDQPGWDATTWVLHAMYEHPDLPAG